MLHGSSDLGNIINKFGTVYATNGTIQTSDTTLKTNIAPLSYGLEELMKIKTISYNWKDDERQITKIGFNAQNLLKVIPEVVQTHSEVTNEETGEVTYEENETLGVFYSDMIPVLTKSIQEQQEIIKKHFLARIMGKLLSRTLKKLFKPMNPDQYNGASLIGLRGIVVKSHGNANSSAFFSAILEAVKEVERQVPEKIKNSLEQGLLVQ